MKTKHPRISNRKEIAKCPLSFRRYGTFARTARLVQAQFQPCRNPRKIKTALAAGVQAVNRLRDCKSIASARGKSCLVFRKHRNRRTRSTTPRILSLRAPCGYDSAMASPGHHHEPVNIQLLVDSIPALIHTARPDGYLDYFNKPWLEYLGATLDKVTGWNWTAFIHPEDVDGIVDKWRGCLASGETFEYETRVRRGDGEYRWMFHHKVPLRDASGHIFKWYGSSLDIEERKTAEEQLRRNAEELQRSEFHLAEGQRLAHLGSWAFDPEGFYYWSPELFRIFGMDPAGTAPSVQEYLDRVHPQDRQSMAHVIERILDEATPFDATKRIVRPDGQIRYIRCVGVPLVDDPHQKKYVGSAIDVTEHEILTQELRRREAYLAEAQRLSHTGSFGWNVSTGEFSWSEETFRIFEFDPSSKVSLQMILERIHPQDLPSVKTEIAAATVGDGIDLEHRLLMPDGKIKYLHVVGRTERHETGSVELIGAVMDVTARKLTEIELRRSKAHLADAQTLSRTGAVGMEPSMKRMFWSDEAARIYGYPPGTEPTRDLLLQRSHPDDLAFFKDIIERGEQGESDFDFEHRLLMPDGSIKHVRVLTHCVRDEAGNEEIVGATMDITERRVAEEALRRREAYLADAQRLSHTGSWAWNVRTRALFWSEELFRIYGLNPQETAPTWAEFMERVHPEDRAQIEERARIESSTNDWADSHGDFRIVLPDGTTKHLHSVAHPGRDSSGEITEIIGTSIDVTEHVLLTQELRRREAFLTEAQRVSLTASIGWDPDSGQTVWSDETYRIFEFDPSVKPTREMVLQRVHPEDRAALQEVIARLAGGATQFEHSYRLLMLDGRVKHVRAIVRLMGQISGRPLLIATLQDVSESKLAEEALNKARSELANVARITTLNALTASIAHEVNQPLAGIVTNASTCLRMLQSDPPNIDGARETARRTIRDGNRASDVITRLRALFSKKEFTLEPLDLNEAIREVIALSLGDLQRNRVILRSELAVNLSPVIGDRVQLQQVILNLVRNASDAMNNVEDRPRELLIRTEEDYDTEKDYGDLVRFSVKDVGIGFTPEARDKLFEAFYSTKNDGMGIGLSISRSIIDAHHGRLWAVQNDGPGVTFSFSVPCKSGASAGA
jgi:PAS domain S-box-containing protein